MTIPQASSACCQDAAELGIEFWACQEQQTVYMEGQSEVPQAFLLIFLKTWGWSSHRGAVVNESD